MNSSNPSPTALEVAQSGPDLELDPNPEVEKSSSAEEPSDANLRLPSISLLSGSNRLPGLLVGVTVVALACAAFFVYDANQTRDQLPDNAAIADSSATSAVVADVSPAMTQLWSYDYRKLDEEKAALPAITTDSFRAEYDSVYKNIENLAPRAKAVVAAKVVNIGVESLRGNEAVLLVFLNQSVNKGGGQQTAAGARLRVEAQKQDGRWKIAAVTPF